MLCPSVGSRPVILTITEIYRSPSICGSHRWKRLHGGRAGGTRPSVRSGRPDDQRGAAVDQLAHLVIESDLDDVHVAKLAAHQANSG